MDVELLISPEANQELEEAYSWYEERRQGLGEEFLSCVEATIQTIMRNPGLYAKIFKDYRRALIRRFPYAVYYEYIDNKIFVYSIFHTSKNPGKWKSRLV